MNKKIIKEKVKSNTFNNKAELKKGETQYKECSKKTLASTKNNRKLSMGKKGISTGKIRTSKPTKFDIKLRVKSPIIVLCK